MQSGVSEATMMMQTITQSGAGMAGAQAIHANVYATQPLAKFGTKQQQEEIIPNIINGTWRTCCGVTEPNTGLETLKLKTQATRKPNNKHDMYSAAPLSRYEAIPTYNIGYLKLSPR